MMRTIEPFMHPANEGDHTGMVLTFLQYLIREFLGRYEDERVKKNKRKLPAKLLMMLGTLQPGRVFPKFLDNVYPAMFAVDEPHRLTQTLDCMFELVFIIASDEKVGIERRKMEKDWVVDMEKSRSPNSPLVRYSIQKLSADNNWKLKENFSTFRFHLFYFLEILIEGIDINDDEATKESSEERVLKKAIDRCVTALFTNTAYAITSMIPDEQCAMRKLLPEAVAMRMEGFTEDDQQLRRRRQVPVVSCGRRATSATTDSRLAPDILGHVCESSSS
ncbi:unnamed protein product [Heligmosomoides polygyrus]|uniref:BLM10_mid domain-containing protein n=1 Tax=Heligmosomoides polygyrus TaxID=6339 RepID=A0A183GEU5_HELPZ|nr:unnamed protein product [Heligmosomoides polygyrus]